MRFAITFALVLSSCGGVDCETGEVQGAYLISYSERGGGTCGPVADFLILVTDDSVGSAVDAECVVISSAVSGDQCTTDVVAECDFADEGIRSRAVTSVTQVEDDGSELEGIMTQTISDRSTGNVLCISTYDLNYRRQ